MVRSGFDSNSIRTRNGKDGEYLRNAPRFPCLSGFPDFGKTDTFIATMTCVMGLNTAGLGGKTKMFSISPSW